MEVIKKINNNVVIGKDNHQREVVIFGKGLGFLKMPYTLDDMNKIERTYYDVDSYYYDVLKDIPEQILRFTTKVMDTVRNHLKVAINPNITFILSDHIHFAITRYKKGLNINMPYSYDLEYEYPEVIKIAKWIVKKINEVFHVNLNDGEITSIAMHLINAEQGCKKESIDDERKQIVNDVIRIIEQHYHHRMDKKSFNYYRFLNHMRYFIMRKHNHEEFHDGNKEMYLMMKELYPDTYQCVEKIDTYLSNQYGQKCGQDELTYLMIHINRLYINEDCNRKGITP